MEEKLPRALPRDVPDYHERQAAHFRALASTVTTRPVKTRLLHEAEEHEQIARGEPLLQPVLKVMGRAVACDWEGRGGGA